MIGMKRVVAAVLCALVALTIALYLLVVRPLLRPSDVTAVAEGALVTEDLLLLGSINVKQAAFLEKWLLGAPQVTAVRGEPALPVADRTLFDHLRAAGVDARHDLDHVLYALYPTSAEAARHAVILVGRFNPAAINTYLTRELKATPRAGAGPTSFEVARTDPRRRSSRSSSPWTGRSLSTSSSSTSRSGARISRTSRRCSRWVSSA